MAPALASTPYMFVPPNRCSDQRGFRLPGTRKWDCGLDTGPECPAASPVQRGGDAEAAELMRSGLERTPLKLTNEQPSSPFPQLLSVVCNINMQIPWA